jgi:hypothetical protein
LRIEQLNIKDVVVAAIPDFVVLKETRRLLLPYLNREEISDFLIGKGNEVLIAQKRKETDDESDEEQGESDSVEADATCFHGCNFTVPGKHPQSEKGSKQNSIGKSPLKGHLWNSVEKIYEDEIRRSAIFNEETYFIKEEDDDENENQAAKGQAKDLQIFTNNVSVEGSITFKHRQKALSTSFQ